MAKKEVKTKGKIIKIFRDRRDYHLKYKRQEQLRLKLKNQGSDPRRVNAWVVDTTAKFTCSMDMLVLQIFPELKKRKVIKDWTDLIIEEIKIKSA